ncbi:unnamed protein product (mitochondrion) [Plasmodiophora brassicae]|uniref:Uncharacterized protein n=1 Tax=Plasmodiophora brassicae TaxID=37360 RepID=A0A0G4IIT6_PLABS|nr:hypothetical protein PBRA_009586 [Plasmodiophora brassicae]SPR00916.1 unnamed protein product [Plasmodiophora brassicae]
MRGAAVAACAAAVVVLVAWVVPAATTVVVVVPNTFTPAVYVHDRRLARQFTRADDMQLPWASSGSTLPCVTRHSLYVLDPMFAGFARLPLDGPDRAWELTPMPSGTGHDLVGRLLGASAAYFDGEVVVVGARHLRTGLPSDEVWSLSLATSRWTSHSILQAARSYCQVQAVAYDLFAIGGVNDRYERMRSVERYNAHRQRWEPAPDLPVPLREGSASCVCNAALVVSLPYADGTKFLLMVVDDGRGWTYLPDLAYAGRVVPFEYEGDLAALMTTGDDAGVVYRLVKGTDWVIDSSAFEAFRDMLNSESVVVSFEAEHERSSLTSSCSTSGLIPSPTPPPLPYSPVVGHSYASDDRHHVDDARSRSSLSDDVMSWERRSVRSSDADDSSSLQAIVSFDKDVVLSSSPGGVVVRYTKATGRWHRTSSNGKRWVALRPQPDPTRNDLPAQLDNVMIDWVSHDAFVVAGGVAYVNRGHRVRQVISMYSFRAGRWDVLVPQMANFGRACAAHAFLPNRGLVLAAGITGDHVRTPSAILYDVAAATSAGDDDVGVRVESLPALSVPLVSPSAAVFYNYMVVVGGIDKVSRADGTQKDIVSRAVFAWSANDAQWRTMADLPAYNRSAIVYATKHAEPQLNVLLDGHEVYRMSEDGASWERTRSVDGAPALMGQGVPQQVVFVPEQCAKKLFASTGHGLYLQLGQLSATDHPPAGSDRRHTRRGSDQLSIISALKEGPPPRPPSRGSGKRSTLKLFQRFASGGSSKNN